MRRRPRFFSIEVLEARSFMDASASLIGGVWRVAGTSGNDVIVIQVDPADGGNYQAIVNGNTIDTRSASLVRSLRVVTGDGDDSVQVNLSAGPNGGAKPALIYGGKGNDVLVGGPGNDRIFGGPGSDALNGNGGSDILRGEAGDDTLTGGDGNDQLFGSVGSDTLMGGGNRNRLHPGIGKDWVYGSYKTDTLTLDKSDVMLGDQEQSRLDSLDDAALRQLVIDTGLKQWGGMLGTTQNSWGGWGYPYYYYRDVLALPGQIFTTSAASGSVTGTTDHSNTNNQVEGVDEADLVKTDGHYIYTLADSNLVIVDASNPDSLQVVSSTPIEGYATSLFLVGDRVAVISNVYDDYNYGYYGGPIFVTPSSGPIATLTANSDPATGDETDDTTDETPEETAGDWVIPPGYNYSRTKLTVIDVADHASPDVVQEETADGYLNDARLIADQLYLILQGQVNVPGPAYRVWTKSDPFPVEPVDPVIDPVTNLYASDRMSFWEGIPEKREYETKDQYTARIQAMPLADLLPMVESIITAADGSSVTNIDLLSDPSAIYIPTDSKNLSLMTVARFDLGTTPDSGEAGPAAASSVLGSSNIVYASNESMYLIDETYDNTSTESGAITSFGDGKVTHIFKFDLTADDVPLVATGVVAGWALNNYALDEYQGNLRIATTSGWGRTSSNNVFVLAQVGEDLVVQGAITDLALGESIYAVRFMGDRGFVVTFLRTDPLYALDLSDPSDPIVVGELKVPGYSTYLHPIDGNHLVAVGRNADPVTGRVTSVQLSLFDVSDLAAPTLVDTLPLTEDGQWWSGYSEAEHNPHAFAYYEEHGIVTLPVAHNEWWNTGGTGIAAVQVDPATGFTLIGEVAQAGYNHRSVRIGDVLYAVSEQSVIAVDLLNPSNVRSSVSTRIETT